MKRLRLRHVLSNFGFGAFFGFVLGIFITWAIDLRSSPAFPEYIPEIFTSAATIFGAAIALGAALAAIEWQADIRREDRHKRLSAARVMAPHAVSQMCELASAGLRSALQMQQNPQLANDVSFRERSFSEIELPSSAIETFRNIMEYAEDRALEDRISLMLREHQVLRARWRSRLEWDQASWIVSPSNLREGIVYWAYLNAIACTLFDWSRGDSESAELLVDEVAIYSALRVAGDVTNYEDYSREVELYARTFARRSS